MQIKSEASAFNDFNHFNDCITRDSLIYNVVITPFITITLQAGKHFHLLPPPSTISRTGAVYGSLYSVDLLLTTSILMC